MFSSDSKYSRPIGGGRLREHPPCLRDIPGDLRFQGVERGEFLLRAQAEAEGDFHVLAVDFLVEVEKVIGVFNSVLTPASQSASVAATAEVVR